MGLYSRYVFPRLCDWSMRDPRFGSLRREVLAQADGDILEIGFGTGLNPDHDPQPVCHLTAVDPGVGMSRLARHRIEQSRIDVDLKMYDQSKLGFDHGGWSFCDRKPVTFEGQAMPWNQAVGGHE